MSSNFPNSLSGFHNAPISKALLVCSVASTLFCEAIPRAASFVFLTSRDDIIFKGQVWRLVTSLLPCDSFPAGLATWLLLYWFRFFERQLGSSKFAAYITFSTVLTILTRVSLCFLPRNDLVGLNGFLAGPAFIALGLVPLYVLKVPTLIPEYFRLFGLRFSDKSLTYLLILQLACSDGSRSIFPAIVSMIGGLVYANDVLGLQSRLRYPLFIRTFCRRHILPIIETGENSTFIPGNISGNNSGGSMQQRGMDTALGRLNGRPAGNLTQRRPGSAPDLATALEGGGGGGIGMQGQGGVQNFGTSDFGSAINNNSLPLGPEPNEEAVERICAMGFDRERAIAALRRSFGDEGAAVNFILSD